jgi:hypothetical protein
MTSPLTPTHSLAMPIGARAEIFTALAELLPGAGLPGRWAGCVPDSEIRCGVKPARLHGLRRFSDAALLHAGVALRKPGTNRLVFSRQLTDTDNRLVVLRGVDGVPYDLLTDNGCLTQSELPLTACLRDRFTLDARSNWEYLFICDTVSDAAVLRSLGLPTTTFAGLQQLSGQPLANFCDLCQIDSVHEPIGGHVSPPDADPDSVVNDPCDRTGEPLANDNDEPETDDTDQVHRDDIDNPVESEDDGDVRFLEVDVDFPPWKWTFVGWSPAEWSFRPPDDLAPTLAQLQQLSHFLGLCLPDIYVWTPSDEVRESLDFADRTGTPGHLAHILRDSASTCAHPLAPPVEPSFSESWRRMLAERWPKIMRIWDPVLAMQIRQLEKWSEPLLELLEEADVGVLRQVQIHRALMLLMDYAESTRQYLLSHSSDQRSLLFKNLRQLFGAISSLLTELFPCPKPTTAFLSLAQRRRRRRYSHRSN